MKSSDSPGAASLTLVDAEDERIEVVAEDYMNALRAGRSASIGLLVAEHPQLGARLERRLGVIERLFRAGHSTPRPQAHDRSTARDPTIGLGRNDQPITRAASPRTSDTGELTTSEEAPSPLGDRTDGAQAPSSEATASFRWTCANCGESVALPAAAPAPAACRRCGSTMATDSLDAQGSGASSGASRMIGKSIGRFHLLKLLGQGGFGEVYKAWDAQLARHVAVKIPRSGTFRSTDEERRFLREARAAAQLKHPNIVEVLEVGKHDDVPFIVSQWIDGSTLAELAHNRALSYQETAQIVSQVAVALAVAHTAKVIHRDIKPSNILIDQNGRAYVSDFGLARRDDMEATITPDGQILGTVQYMSPEQASGESHRVDGRTDIYSLGVVMYRLLTRTLPFVGNRTSVLSQVLSDAPRPPRCVNDHVPLDLEVICLRAMAKEAARRYPTAAAMAEDLRRWLNGEPIVARPASALERLQSWRRRHRVAANLVASVVFLVLTILIAAPVWALREMGLRREAAAAAKESRERLAQTYTSQGLHLLEKGDHHAALVWLTLALELDADDPDRSLAQRHRIAALLKTSPKLFRVWLHEADKLIRHTTFAAGGAVVLSASDGGTARLWSVATGEPLTPAGLRHARSVNHVAATRDAQVIATASADGTAQLWDGRTGEPRTKDGLRHRADCEVAFVGFSPDDQLLVTAGGSYAPDRSFGEARLWDAATGEPASDWLKHEGKIVHAAFSRDGSRLATAGSMEFGGGVARAWDVATGKQVGSDIERSERIAHVEFSADGSRLLTASYDHSAVVWRLDAERDVWTPEFVMLHAAEVYTARFSPDGGFVLTASADWAAHLWDIRGTVAFPVAQFGHAHRVLDAQFSSDGTWLTTASEDGTARVWDATNARPLTPPLRHGGAVVQATLGADGRRLVTAGADGVVKVWDVANLSSAGTVLDHDNELRRVAFAADSRRLITAGFDGVARVWDAVEGRTTGMVLHSSRVTDVAVSPDGDRVASVSWDGEVQVWNRQSAKVLWHKPHGRKLTLVSWSQDGTKVVTASTAGEVKVWDADTGEVLASHAHKGAVVFAQFDSASRRLFTASSDRTATIRANGKAAVEFPHDWGVSAAAWSRDGQRVATSSRGHTRVWNAETAELVAQGMKQDGVVLTIQFSSDGESLLTAASDGTACVWDARTGQRIVRPLEHPAHSVTSASFSPDDRWILTTTKPLFVDSIDDESDYGEARVWDARTGLPITPALRHAGKVVDGEFSRDAARWATASADGSARVWEHTPDDRPTADLIHLAQVLSGSRVDETGAFVPLDPRTVQFDRARLGALYPGLFAATVRDADAWETQQAARFKKLGMWSQAATSLQKLSEPTAAHSDIVVRRASIAAELGQWDSAVRDFSQLRQANPSDPRPWAMQAAALLGAGDADALRQLCRQMSESFGDMPTATVAIHIARTFCLVPDSLPDPGDLKELADLIDSEVEDQSTGALVRGAAAYRTGRLDKAVTSLKPLAEQALYLDSPLAQLYLAMAYQRLGQEMEARQWLNSARQWATSSMQSDIPAIRVHGVAPPPRRSLPRPWYWRVEWDQLLREAERTVDN